MTFELVDDARNWWRWHSIRFLAIGAAVQGVVVAVSNTSMAQYIQPWVLTALSDFALACMLAAGVGRVLKQDKPHV
jgi:hypothetical protein